MIIKVCVGYAAHRTRFLPFFVAQRAFPIYPMMIFLTALSTLAVVPIMQFVACFTAFGAFAPVPFMPE